MPPEICPNCGATVPREAKACPECGSDEQTGWSEETHVDGIDLPDDSFDYEDFVKREFEDKRPVPGRMHWFWWIVAVVILGAFAWLWVRR